MGSPKIQPQRGGGVPEGSAFGAESRFRPLLPSLGQKAAFDPSFRLWGNQSPTLAKFERGFLLLETLLALFILSVGLTLVIRSFGSSLGALRTSDDYTQAMLLLEGRIWELEAKGSIVPGTSGGTFPEENGKYQWLVSASPPNSMGLSEMKITVSFKQRGRPRDLSVVTYLKVESR